MGEHTDMHPTDVLEDADGSLLIVDAGGWFIRCCPTSKIAKPDVLGGIYRVRREGALGTKDPRGRAIDWKESDPPVLASLLADERVAVCQRADPRASQPRRLGDRGDDRSAPKGQNRAWSNFGRAGVSRIDGASARAATRPALLDEHPQVRQAAAYSAGLHRDEAATTALIDLLGADDPQVRRQAATALGRIGKVEAVGPLLGALKAIDDPFLEHALIYAVIQINDRAATLPGLTASSERVRRGALIAIDQMHDGNLAREEVAPLLDTDDLRLQQAALEIISRHQNWAVELVDLVAKWLQAERLDEDQRAALRGTIVALGSEPKIERLVGAAISDESRPQNTRLLFLEAIARGGSAELPRGLRKPLGDSLDSRSEEIIRQAVEVIDSSGGRHFDGELRKLALNVSRGSELRIAAAGPLEPAVVGLCF